MEYGKIEDLEKQLLYKRITKWGKDRLELDDGTVITLEESASECCASVAGEFRDVKLDAVITKVEIGEQKSIPNSETTVNEVNITIYHNQNPIALAELSADAGNEGYYYSIGSVVVNGVHFPVVDA